MGTCESIQTELSAYLDGELPQQEQAACDEHLRGCEQCRATLDSLRVASAAVSSLPRLKAPQTLAARVRQKVLTQPLPQALSALDPTLARASVSVERHPFWRPIVFGVAALVVLCAMAFVMLPALSGQPHYRTAARDRARTAAEPSPAASSTPPRPIEKAADSEGHAAPPAAARGSLAQANRLNAKELAESRPMTPPAAAAPVPLPAPVAETTAGRKAAGMVAAVPPTARPAKAPGESGAQRRAVAAQEPSAQEPAEAARADEFGLRLRGEGLARGVARDGAERAKGEKGGVSLGNEGQPAAPAADKAVGQVEATLRDGALAVNAVEKQQAPVQDAAPAVAAGRAGKRTGEMAENLDDARVIKKETAARPDGFGGAGVPRGKAAPAGELAAAQPAAPGAAADRPSEVAIRQRKAAKLDEEEAAPAPGEPALESAAKAKRAAGPAPADGPGAGLRGAEQAEVLVFRTPDPDRLIAQLQGLAAQNAARWEVSYANAQRTLKDDGEARELKKSWSHAGKAAGGSLDFAIVTAADQRGVLLAKLRELQVADLGGDRGQTQAGTERPRAQTADLKRQPELQDRMAQVETERGEAGKLPATKQAPAAAAEAGQPLAGARREARIRIRIEVLPAADAAKPE